MLESGTKISNLVQDNPLSTDQVAQGDDHIRLIKGVLKASFPSDVDVQIPDLTGHGGSALVVNEDGTAIEWGAVAVDESPINKLIERSTFEVVGGDLVASAGSYYIPSNGAFTSWSTTLTATPPVGTGSARWLYAYIKADDDTMYLDSEGPTKTGTAWLKANDRCITAVRQNADNSLDKIYHDGGDYVMLEDDIALTTITGTNTFQPVTVDGPTFSSKYMITFFADVSSEAGGSSEWYYRPFGSDKSGHLINRNESYVSEYSFNALPVMIGTDMKYELKGSQSNTYMASGVNGFYFPAGI